MSYTIQPHRGSTFVFLLSNLSINYYELWHAGALSRVKFTTLSKLNVRIMFCCVQIQLLSGLYEIFLLFTNNMLKMVGINLMMCSLQFVSRI